MRKLAALACVGMVTVSIAVACAGDDRVKHLSDGGSAGVGDGGQGGVDGVGQGGGSSNPAEGGGGTAALGGAGRGGVGQGGVPEVNGNGGTGAPSPLDEGGMSGGGGSPAVDCPAQTGNFTYQCGEVETLWAPQWSNTLDRFELDVSNLPFPIASGTVSFFYSNADTQLCDTVDVDVSGDIVSAPAGNVFSPIAVRITTFSLVDVCGNHHDFDPTGAPACNDLRGSGSGFGDYTLTCSTRLDAICPEACN
jgi:hypothetical protein